MINPSETENDAAEALLTFRDRFARKSVRFSTEIDETILRTGDGFAPKRARFTTEDLIVDDVELQANAKATVYGPKYYDDKEKIIALLKYNTAMLRSRFADVFSVYTSSYFGHLRDTSNYKSIKEAEKSLLGFDQDNPLRLQCQMDISLMNLTLSKKLDSQLVDNYGVNLSTSCVKLEYIASKLTSFDITIKELKGKFRKFRVRTASLSKLSGRKFKDEKNMLISMYKSISEGIRSIDRDMKVFA